MIAGTRISKYAPHFGPHASLHSTLRWVKSQLWHVSLPRSRAAAKKVVSSSKNVVAPFPNILDVGARGFHLSELRQNHLNEKYTRNQAVQSLFVTHRCWAETYEEKLNVIVSRPKTGAQHKSCCLCSVASFSFRSLMTTSNVVSENFWPPMFKYGHIFAYFFHQGQI